MACQKEIHIRDSGETAFAIIICKDHPAENVLVNTCFNKSLYVFPRKPFCVLENGLHSLRRFVYHIMSLERIG